MRMTQRSGKMGRFEPGSTVFGGNSEEDTPVPIPNTEVKLLCADGTAWETAWESRSLPKFTLKKPLI